MKITELRAEHQLISEWITDGARVLDLGCGDGGFLAALNKEKSVTGYGIEIDPENIVKCIQKGVNVIQANLDEHFFSAQHLCIIMHCLTEMM